MQIRDIFFPLPPGNYIFSRFGQEVQILYWKSRLKFWNYCVACWKEWYCSVILCFMLWTRSERKYFSENENFESKCLEAGMTEWKFEIRSSSLFTYAWCWGILPLPSLPEQMMLKSFHDRYLHVRIQYNIYHFAKLITRSDVLS